MKKIISTFLCAMMLIMTGIPTVLAYGYLWINPIEVKTSSNGKISFETAASTDEYLYKYEWYVDGRQIDSGNFYGNVSSKTLKARSLDYTAGTHTVKCVVYTKNSSGYESGSNYTSKTFTVNSSSSFSCRHNDYDDVYTRTVGYEEYNSSYHYEEIEYRRICEDCDKVIKTGTKSNKKSHSFSNGKCTKCGYTKACSHSRYRDVNPVIIGYERYNETYHYEIKQYSRKCSSCNEVIKTVKKRAKKKHSFSSGDCTKCGFVSTPLINKITTSSTSSKVKFNTKVSSAAGLAKVEFYYGTSENNMQLAGIYKNTNYPTNKRSLTFSLKKSKVGSGTRYVKVVAYDKYGRYNDWTQQVYCN